MNELEYQQMLQREKLVVDRLNMSINKLKKDPADLAPCPFCGDSNIQGPEHGDSCWWVECNHCEICMERDSKRLLIKDWNTRINPLL